VLFLDILVASVLGGLAGVLLFGELGYALTGDSHSLIGLLRTVRRVRDHPFGAPRLTWGLLLQIADGDC